MALTNLDAIALEIMTRTSRQAKIAAILDRAEQGLREYLTTSPTEHQIIHEYKSTFETVPFFENRIASAERELHERGDNLSQRQKRKLMDGIKADKEMLAKEKNLRAELFTYPSIKRYLAREELKAEETRRPRSPMGKRRSRSL